MFSPRGTFPPVGLFSKVHIVSIFICFFLISLVAVLTRKMKKETYFKLLKIFAVVVTSLELLKIVWNLANGYTKVNNWVPLYFCSLFIYSLWFTYFKSEKIKDLGLSYIAIAGIICGAIFIISPSTSFSDYPIFHFQCIYSMVFHSIMIYSGVMLFVTHAFKVDLKAVAKYCMYCAIFMSLAMVINAIFDGNLMFLSNPSIIPLPFLKDIYNFSNIVYTILIVIAHMSLGFVVYGVNKGAELVAQPDEEEKELKS